MALQLVAYRNRAMVLVKPNNGDLKILIPSIDDVFLKHSYYLSLIPEEERYNLYFTLAHHSGINEARNPVRNKSTIEYCDALAFDVDGCDPSRAYEYRSVVAELLQAPADSLSLVDSGNGVHIYAFLAAPILRSANQYKLLKPSYNKICEMADLELAKRDLPGKFDQVIFEPARVMRFPGCTNRKPGKPDRMSSILHFPQGENRLKLDLPALSGMDRIEKENVLPYELRRAYPTPDFAEMVKECRFVIECVEKPEELSEPLAFDLFSLLSTQQQTSEAVVGGQRYSPVSLGEYVHKYAVNSASLAKQPFLDKWENAAKYGARRCETINSTWGKCSICPHYTRIPTPLALRGKDHIGSADSGYWVLNAKGQPTHPAYEDLVKVFSQKQPYLVQSTDRTLVYTGFNYESREEIDLKNWVETHVKPSDPLRENHRREFVAKLKAWGRDTAKNDMILKEGVQGKLPFYNGVLDLITGELLPHSPNYGFLYCLPHKYDPEVVSEYFLEWLELMMLNRPELMQTVLDVMSYCLWPSFDDHVITFLSGEGANGKSTLIEIIRAVLGVDSCASVSVDQLVGNRFMSAQLEGKLVNLCAETSGGELTSKDLNTLKSFSEDGHFTVERKGEHGYTMRNSAKLIFGINKPPIIKEHTHAVKRRLLVIPFDYTIEKLDPRIGKQLLEDEITGITTLLVNNLRANLLKNNGRFKIDRTAPALETAQAYMLTHGNSVVNWAKECVVESPTAFIPVLDAYAHYKEWCELSGMSQMNKLNFTIGFKTLVVKERGNSPQKWIDGRNIRVFENYRMRKENEDENPV